VRSSIANHPWQHDVLEVKLKLQQNHVFHRPQQATYAPFYFNARRYDLKCRPIKKTAVHCRHVCSMLAICCRLAVDKSVALPASLQQVASKSTANPFDVVRP
jgi:hypothetical protein